MVSAERIQITLSGGAPWGFRLSGGGSLPLTINKIRKKSAAHNQGLKEGDAVISINGVHVHDKTQDEALELVENAGDSLALEIFRGDIDELGRDKPKKTIQVPSAAKADDGVITLSATVEELNAQANVQADTSSGLIMTASVDNVTSDSFDTAESDFGHGFKLTATVDEMSGSTFSTADSSSGFTLTASVDSMTSSSNAVTLESSPTISANVESSPVVLAPVESSPVISAPVESSPVISAPIADVSFSQVDDVQSSSTLSATMAEPFVDSKPISPPPINPPRLSPQPPVSSKPQKSVSPQSGYTPQVLPQSGSPQPPQSRSPHPPPAVSPKPVKIASPQPPPVSPKPPGVTSSVASTTFDDGQTRREVTREQHVQKSDDGMRSTIVERETTTTTSHIGRPSMLKNQSSSFNAVQPSNVSQTQRSSTTTSTTTLKSTSNVINNNNNQKGPTPFSSSASTNIPLQPEFQPSPITGSHSSGNLSRAAPPIFKPTKFVPGSGKKEIPGLFTPTSPMVDSSVHSMFKDGKENVAPQPMFQVKNIVSDKAKGKGRDIWRPNVWLPGEQPTGAYEEPSVTVTPKDDFSPYATYPVPKVKPGYSLIEEQKRKLFESQTSKNEYDDFYDTQDHESHGHHKSGRLHIFAPPVEIHADSGYPESPYSPYEEYYLDEYEDGPMSPGSSVIRRKKNLYSDSAFYDTPGKSYPTITEQMKLCKKIAQSLTSAANRRARGAKMFMKRKRKSSKWVHEGHSEWSSSAGDVANLHELDSELSPDEGGNKPLLYFKIPNLKNRLNNEGKSTKMALTQEQFEKLRLNSKKCEHKAVPPDTCFDIVADLKAHKGRGGRMFERRKQRSDKFVIEESHYVPPQRKLENVLSQPVRQEKSPWEAAMEHGGNVDAAFSHLSEWEKNQRLNQILKFSPPRKLQTTPLPPSVQAAPLPAVRSSLRSADSPHLLKGKDFNRTAKGWAGGGEYPVADHLHHVSPTRQLGPSQSTQSVTQNYNSKIKAWQGPRESPYVSNPNQDQWDTGRQQDNWQSRQQDSWQSRRQDNEWADRGGSRQQAQSNGFYQAPRPKSWHQQDTRSHDGYSYRDEIDYTYAPVDYRFGVHDSQTVAYRQPIVPGTDL